MSWYADTSRTARFNALLIVPVPAAPAPAAWRRLPPSAARSQTGGAGRHKCRSCEIGILVTFSHRLLQALIEQRRGIGSWRRFKPSALQFLDTEVCSTGCPREEANMRHLSVWVIEFFKPSEGGGFTLSWHSVLSVSRWFASMSIKQGGATCLRTHANCTKGRGFPSTIPPSSSVSAQAAENYLIPGRANANASSCRILCLKSRDESQRWLQSCSSRKIRRNLFYRRQHILMNCWTRHLRKRFRPAIRSLSILRSSHRARNNDNTRVSSSAQARRRRR